MKWYVFAFCVLFSGVMHAADGRAYCAGGGVGDAGDLNLERKVDLTNALNKILEAIEGVHCVSIIEKRAALERWHERFKDGNNFVDLPTLLQEGHRLYSNLISDPDFSLDLVDTENQLRIGSLFEYFFLSSLEIKMFCCIRKSSYKAFKFIRRIPTPDNDANKESICKCMAVIRDCVEKGANVNAQDINGRTPFSTAIVYGNYEIAHFLLNGYSLHATEKVRMLCYMSSFILHGKAEAENDDFLRLHQRLIGI